NVSNYGIWYKEGCSFGKITHCYIHDLGMGGIKIGNTTRPKNDQAVTNHIFVDNNIIQSGGFEIPTGVGVIIFHASDNTVSHNDIGDFRYSGVSVGWVWGYTPSVAKRNKIVYNRIHHLGWGELSDMGGVYTLGLSEGTVVSNNVIHDIYSYGYGGWGLYTDEGSTGIVMENNLVYNCKSSGFHQHYGEDNIIRNNIFAFNLISQLQATRIEPHNSFTFTNNIIYFDSGFLLGTSSGANWHKINLKTDYNCYWDTRTKDIRFENMTFKEWQAQGKDIHSIIADPGFVNPKQFDFNFKNRNTIRKIGFKPFDYSKAGVYGEKSWMEKASLSLEIINAYNKTVNKQINELDL
ncbi:MAG: right-handed parallel beta-helix repeat-containing protein, partial [Petrimonas sp.]|nr:right-handed parallel beta-helix repeat-containing protein [Petrimonas sp.]